MARTIVDLVTSASWTLLGDPGQSTITIKTVPITGIGVLLLNTTDDETPGPTNATDSAQAVTPNRGNDQFSNTSATDQLYARSKQGEWSVIVDQE